MNLEELAGKLADVELPLRDEAHELITEATTSSVLALSNYAAAIEKAKELGMHSWTGEAKQVAEALLQLRDAGESIKKLHRLLEGIGIDLAKVSVQGPVTEAPEYRRYEKQKVPLGFLNLTPEQTKDKRNEELVEILTKHFHERRPKEKELNGILIKENSVYTANETADALNLKPGSVYVISLPSGRTLYKNEDGTYMGYEILRYNLRRSLTKGRRSIHYKEIARLFFISERDVEVLVQKRILEQGRGNRVTKNSFIKLFDQIFPMYEEERYKYVMELLGQTSPEEKEGPTALLPAYKEVEEISGVFYIEDKVLRISNQKKFRKLSGEQLEGLITEHYHNQRPREVELNGVIIKEEEEYEYADVAKALDITISYIYKLIDDEKILSSGRASILGKSVIRYKYMPSPRYTYSSGELAEILYVDKSIIDRFAELKKLEYSGTQTQRFGRGVATKVYNKIWDMEYTTGNQLEKLLLPKAL